ncbi:MAG: hypothetical protein H5T86_06020, partial [Armatimonadetes bacterium]|nr:hypothetical protein [Armatimonadota bacterium]
LEGPVSASLFNGRRLPYPDNIANLVVVENRFDLPLDEVIRVLAPGGTAFVKSGAGWDKVTKPMPAGMDEWTHYAYDASGNAVSRDTLVGPPRHVQWSYEPRHARNHEYTASEMALVAAGGRVFYIGDETPESAVEPPAQVTSIRTCFLCGGHP